MSRRFTFALFLFAACPLAVVAVCPADVKPVAKDQPPNPKLEPKNFVEKVTGVQDDHRREHEDDDTKST